MPEVVANYLTVDEFGRVQAEFAGHIIGTGVVLPIGGQISPNDDNAVTWYLDQRVPASDPRGRKGFIRGTTDGQIPDVFSVSHQATRVDRSATAEIDAQVSAGLPPGWNDSAQISLLCGSMGKDAEQRLLLDGAGNSDFVIGDGVAALPIVSCNTTNSNSQIVAQWTWTAPFRTRYLVGVWGMGYQQATAVASWFTPVFNGQAVVSSRMTSGIIARLLYPPSIWVTQYANKGDACNVTVLNGSNFQTDASWDYISGAVIPIG